MTIEQTRELNSIKNDLDTIRYRLDKLMYSGQEIDQCTLDKLQEVHSNVCEALDKLL